MNRIATIALSLLTLAAPLHAAWPAKVFVPYQYLGTGDDFKLTDCDDAIGVKYYTLAFIIADKDGQPAWDGHTPMSEKKYLDQVEAIRGRGGDVLISFGGEGGTEIALVEPDVEKLTAKYQSVIDTYKVTMLDFDIEGKALDKNPEASKRRNTAIAALQKKNPGLMISFTLPVDPNGISDASQALLKDAVAQGVKVHSANIMTMYYGKEFIHKGKSEGELSIESANKAHEQTTAIDPQIQIGLCPCIGRNGSKEEIFDQDDAKTLKAFADKTDWVCSLSFWSINRDRELKKGGDTTSEIPSTPWAFSNVFKSFTSPK